MECEGVEWGEQQEFVRGLTKQCGADVYVFLETKLTGGDATLLKEVWHNRWLEEFHLDAVGRSGGIVVMWDKRYWMGELVGAGGQMLTCKLLGVEQNLSWFPSAVYADCNIVIRRELWKELTIRDFSDGPWVVCGDFNVTRYPN